MRIWPIILVLFLLNPVFAANETTIPSSEEMNEQLENERPQIVLYLVGDFIIAFTVAIFFGIMIWVNRTTEIKKNKWCISLAICGLLTFGVISIQMVKIIYNVFLLILTFFLPDLAYTMIS
jgi:hypothetical protein